jgi:hypothetical protein
MCQLISSHPAPQKWARIEAGGEVFTEVEDAARPLGSGFFVGRIGAEKRESNISPRKNQGDTPDHRWRIGSAASAATVSLDPAAIGTTDMRNAVVSMGVIDEKTFTRECIIRCLRTLDDRLRVEGFPTCDECLQAAEGQDLVLYHLREDPSRWDKNSQKLISFRKLLSIVSVVILSDTETPDSLAEIFESGARGFIPTDTTLEQIIEIIGLVCVEEYLCL